MPRADLIDDVANIFTTDGFGEATQSRGADTGQFADTSCGGEGDIHAAQYRLRHGCRRVYRYSLSAHQRDKVVKILTTKRLGKMGDDLGTDAGPFSQLFNSRG
ncbi:hypothetical protein D3C78_1311050 [compost metagenome]